MMKMSIHNPRQRGTTLLEVLIAILVLAIGLLGTAAMQTRAQQAELDAYQRSQALVLAQDMVSRISTNRRAARCYVTTETDPDNPDPQPNYVGTGVDPDDCTGWGTIATRARADEDLQEWADLLRGASETLDGAEVGSMAGARGCVHFDDVDEIYTVTVAWQGENLTQAPVGNNCAAGQYGDEARRRVVSLSLEMANLGP